MTAFKQNKNAKEIIRSNKTKKESKQTKLKLGKYSSCLTNTKSLCCKQVRKTTVFKCQQATTKGCKDKDDPHVRTKM